MGWKPGKALTFDIWNLTAASQRRIFQFSNADYGKYTPGRSYFAGLRAKF